MQVVQPYTLEVITQVLTGAWAEQLEPTISKKKFWRATKLCKNSFVSRANLDAHKACGNVINSGPSSSVLRNYPFQPCIEDFKEEGLLTVHHTALSQ